MPVSMSSAFEPPPLLSANEEGDAEQLSDAAARRMT